MNSTYSVNPRSLDIELGSLSSSIGFFEDFISQPQKFTGCSSALHHKAFASVMKALSVVERVLERGNSADLIQVNEALALCSRRLEMLQTNWSGDFQLIGSEPNNLLATVRLQLEKTFEGIQKEYESRSVFLVEDLPLCKFYQSIQDLKREPSSSNQEACRSLFYSLCKGDQDLFFQTFGMNELTDLSFSQIIDQTDLFLRCFEIFLLWKIDDLSILELSELNQLLIEIGKEDKIYIENWDKEWGKYHLTEDINGSPWASRFIRALNRKDVRRRQQEFSSFYQECVEKYGLVTAQSFFKYCLSVDAVRKGNLPSFTEEMKKDIFARADILIQLRVYKAALSNKHPTLNLQLNDPSHPLCKMWKAKELGVLLCPEIASMKCEDLLALLNSLVKEKSDPASDEILLEVILKRHSNAPRQDQIEGGADLCFIKIMGMQQAAQKELHPSGDSRCKSIFTIHSSHSDVIGKYKPNYPGVAAREVRGYDYDSILGFGFTPPTGFAQLSMQSALLSLKDSFQLAEDMCKIATALEKAKQPELAHLRFKEAMELHKKAMDLADRLPDEIKQGLYNTLSARINFEYTDCGAGLWWNNDCKICPDRYRVFAIQDFLNSESFNHFKMTSSIEMKCKTGSIQKWISGSQQRVIDFLVNDRAAGERLREISKAQVHLYCILGLIKGSRDGFSGNALVSFSENGAVNRIYEFDDERSMPADNEFKEFRLWQFGLPQADLPFDRTVALLFSKTSLLKQFQSYNRSDRKELIFPRNYAAQEERIAKMIELFQNELEKPSPTLTPRELFFELFGGKENFDYWHYDQGLNPWHVFEYCTGDVGRGCYFTEEDNREILAHNFQVLFDGEEGRARTLLDKIRVDYPNTRLIIKMDVGFGNHICIRGSLPGTTWYLNTPLKCVNNNCWIFESDSEIVSGQFKVYLNGYNPEKNPSSREIQSNCKSLVIFPEF